MPNGKVTIRELCLKLDDVRDRNDKEHSQIIERLDRIEAKLDNFPFKEHEIQIDILNQEVSNIKLMTYAGVIGLVGWLGTVILWLADKVKG